MYVCVGGGFVWGGSITSLMSCWVLRPRPYQAPVTVMAIEEIVRMDVRMCFRVAILDSSLLAEDVFILLSECVQHFDVSL